MLQFQPAGPRDSPLQYYGQWGQIQDGDKVLYREHVLKTLQLSSNRGQKVLYRGTLGDAGEGPRTLGIARAIAVRLNWRRPKHRAFDLG